MASLGRAHRRRIGGASAMHSRPVASRGAAVQCSSESASTAAILGPVGSKRDAFASSARDIPNTDIATECH